MFSLHLKILPLQSRSDVCLCSYRDDFAPTKSVRRQEMIPEQLGHRCSSKNSNTSSVGNYPKCNYVHGHILLLLLTVFTDYAHLVAVIDIFECTAWPCVWCDICFHFTLLSVNVYFLKPSFVNWSSVMSSFWACLHPMLWSRNISALTFWTLSRYAHTIIPTIYKKEYEPRTCCVANPRRALYRYDWHQCWQVAQINVCKLLCPHIFVLQLLRCNCVCAVLA